VAMLGGETGGVSSAGDSSNAESEKWGDSKGGLVAAVAIVVVVVVVSGGGDGGCSNVGGGGGVLLVSMCFVRFCCRHKRRTCSKGGNEPSEHVAGGTPSPQSSAPTASAERLPWEQQQTERSVPPAGVALFIAIGAGAYT